MEFSNNITQSTSYLPNTEITGVVGPSAKIIIPIPEEFPIHLSPLLPWNVVDPILFPNRNQNENEIEVRSKIFTKFSAFRVINKRNFDGLLFAIMARLCEIAFVDNTPAKIKNELSQICKGGGRNFIYFGKYLGCEPERDKYIIDQFFHMLNSGTEADQMNFGYESDLNRKELQDALVILLKSGIKIKLDRVTVEEKQREGFLSIVSDLTATNLDYGKIQLYTSCICEILRIKICILLMDKNGPGLHHEIIGQARRYDFPTAIQLITRGDKIFIGECPSFPIFGHLQAGDWYRGIAGEPERIPPHREEIKIEEVKERRSGEIPPANRSGSEGIGYLGYPPTVPNSRQGNPRLSASEFAVQEESKNTAIAASNLPLNLRNNQMVPQYPPVNNYRQPREGIPFNIPREITNVYQEPPSTNPNSTGTYIFPNTGSTMPIIDIKECNFCTSQVNSVITCPNLHLICNVCNINYNGCPVCQGWNQTTN